MRSRSPAFFPSLVCASLLVLALAACGAAGSPAAPPPPAAETPVQPQPAAGTPQLAADDLAAALAAETTDDRPEVLAALGRPDAFDISFVAVDGGQVRMESWRYYQFGVRVDFVDGEAVWTMEIEPLPDGTLFAAWYDPLAFAAGMMAADASRLIAAASPAGAAPERVDLAAGGEDLAGGAALVGDQILIGLHEERVVYVETVALIPEGGAP